MSLINTHRQSSSIVPHAIWSRKKACVCSYSCQTLLTHLSGIFQTFQTGADQSILYVSFKYIGAIICCQDEFLHQRTLTLWTGHITKIPRQNKHPAKIHCFRCNKVYNKDYYIKKINRLSLAWSSMHPKESFTKTYHFIKSRIISN